MNSKFYTIEEALQKLRKIDEAIIDYIPKNSIEKLTKSLVGEKVEHINYGEGIITNFELDEELDLSYLSSSWGILYIDFEESGLKVVSLSWPSNYLIFSKKSSEALNLFKEELYKAKGAEQEEKKVEAREKALELAEKHFADKFDVWYRYLTGSLKTRPNDMPYDLDKEAYVEEFERLKQKAKRNRRIANSFDDVDGTIEATYSGNVKELIAWLKEHITSIVISPSRELDPKEGEEVVQAILDYIKECGGTLDKVSAGRSGGAMKNYDMHLDANALESCPDLEAFMIWQAPKFNMKTGEEVSMPTYDKNAGSISSRKVVLDYLLNRDNYLNEK